jgi:hypothetical protein
VVQKQLRHSDARITLGVHGHVIGNQQRDALARDPNYMNRSELFPARILWPHLLLWHALVSFIRPLAK